MSKTALYIVGNTAKFESDVFTIQISGAESSIEFDDVVKNLEIDEQTALYRFSLEMLSYIKDLLP